MNSICVIKPYKYHGQWVFDDSGKGLVKEALVAGIDIMLDMMCKKLGTEDIVAVFSDKFFPTANLRIDHVRPDIVGNWYKSLELGIEGWLCPALFKYFPTAPDKIYIEIKGA